MSEISLLGFNALSFLAETTKQINMVERMISEAPSFKGERFPYTSPFVQSALNEARYARMFCGDCLRMVINRENPRTNLRFNPSDYGAVFSDNLPPSLLELGESILIQTLKEGFRQNLYTLFDCESSLMNDVAYYLPHLTEFQFYYNQCKASLKKADQNLGLRIGEILSHTPQ